VFHVEHFVVDRKGRKLGTMEASDNKSMKRPAMRPALGRGLSALISTPPVPVTPVATAPANEPDPEVGSASGVRFLSMAAIVPNPTQPRQHFSEQEIAELADSIRQMGVLQPILVRPSDREGVFEIVAGERRFRAATKVGLSTVPVIVRSFTDRETLEVALVENVQRQNLNPMEEAKGYQRLMDEFSLSGQEVAEKVGKDRATISNIVRLLRLPRQVQLLVGDGRISVGHAKAILTVKEPAVQISLAQKVLDEGLSVRALEAIVSRSVVLESPRVKVATPERPGVQAEMSSSPHPEVEDRLRNIMGTKVTIKKSKQGGAVELHFYSDAELERIIEMLTSLEGR